MGPLIYLISHLLTSVGAIKNTTANMWEYKVGKNANIANFLCEKLDCISCKYNRITTHWNLHWNNYWKNSVFLCKLNLKTFGNFWKVSSLNIGWSCTQWLHIFYSNLGILLRTIYFQANLNVIFARPIKVSGNVSAVVAPIVSVTWFASCWYSALDWLDNALSNSWFITDTDDSTRKTSCGSASELEKKMSASRNQIHTFLRTT